MSDLLLMCMIAGRRAAFPALRVQSVIEIEDVTPIPGVAPFIRGLTALRSQALTVIDCATALGFEDTADISGRRAAVVDIGGHTYALVVDEAYDVGEARSELSAIPGGFGAGWDRVAKGMVETDRGPTVLIDAGALIAGPMVQAA